MKLPIAAALFLATSAALTASTAFAQDLPKGDCAAPAPRQDLSGCDFSGRDLAGRDFSGTVLENARFNGARLEGARFEKAMAKWTN
nr:pentapeptide repeat-containing protein [Thauera sp.]